MTEEEEWLLAINGPWPEGVKPANPNEIAIALHEWFRSVPSDLDDDLWREVCTLLFDGAPYTSDYENSMAWHRRCAEAYKAIQLLQRQH